jgi:hypothetical protein
MQVSGLLPRIKHRFCPIASLSCTAITTKRDKKERNSFLSPLIGPTLSGYPQHNQLTDYSDIATPTGLTILKLYALPSLYRPTVYTQVL